MHPVILISNFLQGKLFRARSGAHRCGQVLDSRRYEEEEKEKGAREEEAIEAWHAITGSVDTNSEAAATVNAAQLKHM